MAPEIKKLLSELTPHKKTLVIVILAGLLMAVAQASQPALVKALIDNLQVGDQKSLFRLAGLTVLVYALIGLGRYYHLFLMNYTGEKVIQGLRQKLQSKFMRLNLSFHNNYASGSGGLISRILNDIVVIQNGLRMFADFFREPILFVGLLGWLFWLNWKLTLSIFTVLPLILWFLRQISKTIKTHSIKGQEDLEKITSTIKESLDGVRIIQSFNLETEMQNRFLRESNDFLHSRKKVHSRVELAGPVTEFIAAALIVSIIVFMSFEISVGHSTIGDFMSYLAAMLALNGPIKKLQESYVRIQETGVAAKRVYSLLEEDSEVPQSTSLKSFPKLWNKISYQKVCFNYGDKPILKTVNLTISKGEMIAFVGASGSGKSTLVNLLERFYDPTSGSIYIDDCPIADISLSELRHNIALVTQDVFLFSDTIEKNIWAGDFGKSAQAVEGAAKMANANQFILNMPNSYQSRVGDRGNLLSGGEKQRISIARAVFKDAPILILDEATSALDSASEIEVQKGLDHLMQGRTVLVIAHRLSTIARADRIVVMKSGEIVEVGTHKDLLNQAGEYAHLYNLQYQHMTI